MMQARPELRRPSRAAAQRLSHSDLRRHPRRCDGQPGHRPTEQGLPPGRLLGGVRPRHGREFCYVGSAFGGESRLAGKRRDLPAAIDRLPVPLAPRPFARALRPLSTNQERSTSCSWAATGSKARESPVSAALEVRSAKLTMATPP